LGSKLGPIECNPAKGDESCLTTQNQYLAQEITKCCLVATTEPSQQAIVRVLALSQRKAISTKHLLSISLEEVTPVE